MSASEETTYRTLLGKNREVRNLWLAELFSQIGDWFNFVAIFSAVAALGGAGEVIGFVLVIQTLPHFVMAPLAGWVADRFDRRRVMLTTDFVRIAIVLTYPFAIRADSMTLLFVLFGAQHTVGAFFSPAKQAILPRFAKGRELILANSLWGVSWTTTGAVGSMIGGLVVAGFGTTAAFMADALTFVVSAALIFSLPKKVPPAETADDEASEGKPAEAAPSFLAALRKSPRLRASVLVKFAMSTTGGAYWVILVLFGQTVFPIGDKGAVSVGLLNGAMAVGALGGTLLAPRIFSDTTKNNGWSFFWSFTVRAGAYLGFALSPNLALCAFWGGVVSGLGALPFIGSTTMIHKIAPDGVRGRAFAWDQGLLTLGYAASTLVAGRLIDSGGIRLAGEVFTGVCGVVALVWLVTAVRWKVWHARETEPET